MRPIALRSADTCAWSTFGALGGGAAPQMSSTSSCAGTAEPPSSARRARTRARLALADVGGCLERTEDLDHLRDDPSCAHRGATRCVERVGEGATGVVYRAEGDVASRCCGDTDPVVREAVRARGAARGDDRVAPPRARSSTWATGSSSCRYFARGSLADALPLGRSGAGAGSRRRSPQALDALHAAGIVHRDVKPSNVLLGDDGAVLADFGLARGVDSTQLTHDGQLLGTAHYLAPELIEGAVATPASDVYAFACLLYEAATGAPPFAGRDEAEIGYAHLVEEPPRPGPAGRASATRSCSGSRRIRATGRRALRRSTGCSGLRAGLRLRDHRPDVVRLRRRFDLQRVAEQRQRLLALPDLQQRQPELNVA